MTYSLLCDKDKSLIDIREKDRLKDKMQIIHIMTYFLLCDKNNSLIKLIDIREKDRLKDKNM